MKTKTCEACNLRKVCFMQKQIENLAERMTQPPFNEVVDQTATRTIATIKRYEKREIRRFALECELKRMIGLHCVLFS